MRTHFTTPKGTELTLMHIKGKEYLQVAQRMIWRLEEKPEWRISTKIISLKEDSAVVRAVIRNEQGHIMATAHKLENRAGFADFLEKAETGAIGRALAMVGFGTQFTGDELDEGSRLADSPIVNKSNSTRKPLHNYAPQSSPQEDEIPNFEEPPWDEPNPQQQLSQAPNLVTGPQVKRLWAIAHSSGWQNFEVLEYASRTFNVKMIDRLNRKDYDSLVKHIESNQRRRI